MSLTENYKLFTPLQMGNNLVIKNRIVLGPATRARINPASHAPNEMNAIYYEQRAGAGLIISEGVPSLSRDSAGMVRLDFLPKNRPLGGRRLSIEFTRKEAKSSCSCGTWAGNHTH